MGPHQTSVNATHIPAPVQHLPCNIQTHHLIENLAPIKIIAHHLLTETFPALGEKCTGPKMARTQHW